MNRSFSLNFFFDDEEPYNRVYEILTLYPERDLFIERGFIWLKHKQTIRVEENDYLQATEILKFIGMSYSQAINMFNRMVVLNQGMPFEARIPNETTMVAMEEVLAGINCEEIMIDELEADKYATQA